MMNDRISAMTGLSLQAVNKMDDAHDRFLAAMGVAHGDADLEASGTALREKYPELLRASVTRAAGSKHNRITNELEATIVQLESGETARNVVSFLAAYQEAYGVMSAEQLAAYRRWAKEWTSR